MESFVDTSFEISFVNCDSVINNLKLSEIVCKKEPHLLVVYDYCAMPFEYMYDNVYVQYVINVSRAHFLYLRLLDLHGTEMAMRNIVVLFHTLLHLKSKKFKGEKHCKINNCKHWEIYCELDKLTVTKREYPTCKYIYILSKYK